MNTTEFNSKLAGLLEHSEELRSGLYNLKFNLALLKRNVTRLKQETAQTASAFYGLSNQEAGMDQQEHLRHTGS